MNVMIVGDACYFNVEKSVAWIAKCESFEFEFVRRQNDFDELTRHIFNVKNATNRKEKNKYSR